MQVEYMTRNRWRPFSGSSMKHLKKLTTFTSKSKVGSSDTTLVWYTRTLKISTRDYQ